MSLAERQRYVRVVKAASSDPRFKSDYDALLTIHKTLFPTSIHEVEHFLPWHRWFLLQYENLLRKVDCRFTVTYWDYTAAPSNPWRAVPGDVWYDGDSGFGGDGVAPDKCVRSGPFGQGAFSLVPSAAVRCVQREFNGNPVGPEAIQRLLANDNFLDFENTWRLVHHANIHCLHIGGTSCTPDSASAPEFILIHGYVDKVWEDWQTKNAAKRNAYFPAVAQEMPGTNGLHPRDVLDLQRQPGGVRVQYQQAAPQRTQQGEISTLPCTRARTRTQQGEISNPPLHTHTAR